MPDQDNKPTQWSRPISEILLGGLLGGVAFFAGGALWNWIASRNRDEDEDEL